MKRSTNNPIVEDGTYRFIDVVGDIKKIAIKSDYPLTNVEVEFLTVDGEILYKTNLENNIVVLYPYNFQDSQGRGSEYYSDGDVFMKVNGLIENQQINSVVVYYA